MKVKELRKILKNLPADMEVHIKWLNAVSPLRVSGVDSLAREKGSKTMLDNRHGRVKALLLSPFDVRIGSRDY